MLNKLRNLFLLKDPVKEARLQQDKFDIYMILFAATLKQLRRQEDLSRIITSNNNNNNNNNDKSQNQASKRQKLIDRVSSTISKDLNDNSSIKAYRTVLHETMRPQIIELFESFREADENACNAQNVRDFIDEMVQKYSQVAAEKESLVETKKRELFRSQLYPVEGMLNNGQLLEQPDNWRLRNMYKAHYLKQKLGYSIQTFNSTVDNEGVGVFVDGKAQAGSVVGFFPGDVWLREHLRQPSIRSHFVNDDHNYQLSIRPDEILIDSRPCDNESYRKPYNIPTNDGSNPWALAHLTNHGKIPQCLPVMINYFEEDYEIGLQTYAPGVYGKPPTLLGTIDRRSFLHGLCLVSFKDVCDEELFYDYRLRGQEREDFPSWYCAVDQKNDVKCTWDGD